jgi:hypothetical protein
MDIMREEIKTLQQCKDLVARRHGNNDWDAFIDEMAEEQRTLIISDYGDEAAELYAAQFKPSAPDTEVEKPDWKSDRHLNVLTTSVSFYSAIHDLADIRHAIVIAFGVTDQAEIERILKEAEYPIGSEESFIRKLNHIRTKALHSLLKSKEEEITQHYSRIKELEEALRAVYSTGSISDLLAQDIKRLVNP